MPVQIQLKMVEMVEIEPESDVPRPGEEPGPVEGFRRRRRASAQSRPFGATAPQTSQPSCAGMVPGDGARPPPKKPAAERLDCVQIVPGCTRQPASVRCARGH